VDEEGHPTQIALHRVLELFNQRLKGTQPPVAPPSAPAVE
jgi:hypothetical protein